MLLILSIVFFLFYNTEANSYKELVKKEASNETNHIIAAMNNEFRLIFSDLMFLSEQNELQQALDTNETINWEDLASEYLSFSASKQIYDQIRFIDETGMEIVRVDFKDGNPIIVPHEQLQPKAKRYYFEDTFILAQGEIYVSPLDLNIEHGEIEQPLKPMIRFGAPIFDRNGHKRGVVILNYLADNMIHHLEITPGGLDQIMLLNSDGYWLHNLNTEDEWGFMYPDKEDRTFGNDFPEAWLTITADESGQFFNADGLFTFVTIYPLLEGQKSSTGSGSAFEPTVQQIEGKEYYWKSVTYVPSSVLSAALDPILTRILLIFAFMVAVAASGSWIGAQATVRRKQAEEEILKANTELAALNKELEAFSYSVSHDLRAPLRSMDGFSQVLLEDYQDRLDEQGKDYLQRVRLASQRMGQLIDDILKLSRVTRSEMKRETVDLSALAQTVVAELKERQLERQVEFVIAKGLITNGDKGLLGIVLENLLGNAWKFTSKHSSARIEFGTNYHEDKLVYFVRDDGSGFDMAYVDKLFGAFQRLHAASEFPGTGIGLATVQRIIHRHGGRVWAEGEMEKGTTFYFTLQ
jgi:signal transduction histidine kinase